jgi:hypothetical protein
MKAITYCTSADEQKRIASALSGHFVSLGSHVIGARTVESILQLYPPKLTRALRAEFYGKVKHAIISSHSLNETKLMRVMQS